MKRKATENKVDTPNEKPRKLLDNLNENNVIFRRYPNVQYDRKLPYFRKPTEIGSFSVDKTRCFINDRSQMKHFVPPKNANSVKYDLSVGYKDMVRKNEDKKEFINNILRWIMLHRNKFQLQTDNNIPTNERDLHTDFICWRGLLTKLMCTPYENRDDWLIAVTKFNNTIYMCEFDTEQRKKSKAEMTARQDEMCYWGWKFEQYLTADEPNGTPVTTKPVNNNEEFGVVVRTRLESHSMVFAGEVDTKDMIDSSKECKYVELKTTREIENNRQLQNFQRFKLIKWWAQSYLIGIPKIVCGYRDDDGVVHRLEKFNTLDIPRMVQDLRDPWKQNVILNHLDQLLTFLKTSITVDNPRQIYLMSWQPNHDVKLQKLPLDDSEYQFLPEWYINDQVLDSS